MNKQIFDFVGIHYEKTKYDLFSAFIEHSFSLVKENGHIGFMTPMVWMFISSYGKMRNEIINEKSISSLIQLEYSAFEEATVPICTFVLRNYSTDLLGDYIDLTKFVGGANQPIKVKEAISDTTVSYRHFSNQQNFKKVPNSPIAYWLSDKTLEVFEQNPKLGEIAEPRQGMATSDNNRFLRLWTEVDINKVGFNFDNLNKAVESKLKWFPYNKGGDIRKWYGNNEYIVNWENDGEEIKNYASELYKSHTRTIKNIKYYFRKGITYTFISSSKFGVRYSPDGFIFDVAGSTIFPDEEDIHFFTAFLCSSLTYEFLKIQNPTLNFQVGNIKNLPIKRVEDTLIRSKIEQIAKDNISISKVDWDNYESSWDFKKHPLLNYGSNSSIEDAFNDWLLFTKNQFKQLKINEEEINRLFLGVYNLQDEISGEVPEEDVTVRIANREKDIKSFISYAIGCIFGRYSLDEDGLIYAGGEFNIERYKKFKVDKDNILPILPGAYFEDDIVSKVIDFLKESFGEETLTKNLEFIAETLGKKKGETAKETLRRYLLNDFFKDHIQTYKKRPIYWLFTSGKQKAFNCLVYMHRYDRTTLSRIRTDYLHEYQIRLDAEKKDLLSMIEGDYPTKEISNAKKELKALDKKIDELKEYDELLHHMADMQIEIDLDDGVKDNYEKFKGLVAKI